MNMTYVTNEEDVDRIRGLADNPDNPYVSKKATWDTEAAEVAPPFPSPVKIQGQLIQNPRRPQDASYIILDIEVGDQVASTVCEFAIGNAFGNAGDAFSALSSSITALAFAANKSLGRPQTPATRDDEPEAVPLLEDDPDAEIVPEPNSEEDEEPGEPEPTPTPTVVVESPPSEEDSETSNSDED